MNVEEEKEQGKIVRRKKKKKNGREAVHLSDQMDLDNILEIALSCKTACMFWLLE